MRNRMDTKRLKRLLRRLDVICLLIVVAVFCVLEGIVLIGSHSSENQEGDALIILGAQVYHSGPSPVLKSRLTAALAYLDDHPEIPIVVSGGQGADELVSEAEAMERYLVEHGVAQNRIHREDQSFNTYQNLENSAQLLQNMGYDLDETRVMIVSNDFHLTRVRMLANRCGLQAGVVAAPMPDWSSTLYSYTRETLALVKSFLLDRGGASAPVASS